MYVCFFPSLFMFFFRVHWVKERLFSSYGISCTIRFISEMDTSFSKPQTQFNISFLTISFRKEYFFSFRYFPRGKEKITSEFERSGSVNKWRLNLYPFINTDIGIENVGIFSFFIESIIIIVVVLYVKILLYSFWLPNIRWQIK